MKDTPQVKTNHCPMCEDAAKRIEELEARENQYWNAESAAKRIEELERHNSMLIDAMSSGLKYIEDLERQCGVIACSTTGEIRQAINATSAKSSAWLNKKHMEWIGRPIAEVKDIEIVWLRKFGDGYLYAIPSLTEKGDE